MYKLLRAGQNGDLITVKHLVDVRGVDPQCRDSQYGGTPLHWAAYNGHLDVVRYLVEEKGCDIKCRNNTYDTPLHVAAQGGKLDTVQYLIVEQNCGSMCRGGSGRTPLHHACQEGNLDVVRYLIDDQKVDPSHEDSDGLTPLHVACGTGQLSVVMLLVEDSLCDPGLRDKWGSTPLDIARKEGQRCVASYLSTVHLAVSKTTVPPQETEPGTKKLRLDYVPDLKPVGSSIRGSEVDQSQLAGSSQELNSTQPTPSAGESKRGHTSSGHPLDARPTIKQLLLLNTRSGGSIDIKTTLAADWKGFGFYFDFDADGSFLNLTEAECGKLNPVACYQHMMMKWVSGSGEQPASWRTLLKLLREYGKNTLAKDIEDALIQNC